MSIPDTFLGSIPCELCDVMDSIKSNNLYKVYDESYYIQSSKCSACNSLGRVRVDVCTVCGGMGTVLLRNALKKYRKEGCKICEGKGYLTGPLTDEEEY